MTMVASRVSRCAAKCGRLIRPGDAYECIDAAGDTLPDGSAAKTAYVHAACLEVFETNLRTAQVPVRANESSDVPHWGYDCERCGSTFAARRPWKPEVRCPAHGHTNPRPGSGPDGIGPENTCGGRLDPWDDNPPPVALRAVS